jgi:hypothetical protein
MAKKNLKTSTSRIALLAVAQAAVKKSAKPAPAKKAAAPAKKQTAKPAKASKGPALPGRYEEPLESYSPYMQHRVLLEKWGTDEAGQAKVFKYGTETLDLPATQVKTYIREKLVAIQRDEMKALGLHPTKSQVEAAKEKKAEDMEIDYRYPTKDAARKALLACARRNHLRETVFHIVSANGKFAFVPVHILPEGKTPTFKKGDMVVDAFIDDSRAEVIDAGPEVSIIRYVTERKYAPKEQAVSNRYLIKVEKKAEAPKTEGQKAVERRQRSAKGGAAAAKKAAKKAK